MDLFFKAIKDFNALCGIVSTHKGTLEDLAFQLGGKNYDGELFDCDYGIISATIFDRGNGVLEVSKSSIDVWDETENDFEYVASYSYSELVQKCCK